MNECLSMTSFAVLVSNTERESLLLNNWA